MDPSTHPSAPDTDTHSMLNRPLDTSDPENGIIISEGRGTQADSIPIVRTIPGYPKLEMTLIIHCAIG